MNPRNAAPRRAHKTTRKTTRITTVLALLLCWSSALAGGTPDDGATVGSASDDGAMTSSATESRTATAKAFTWGPWRGFTGKTTLTEKDIADLAATGATLLRVTASTRPLMDAEPPYAINLANVTLLDAVIDACAKHGLKVVIDPHTAPGTTTPYTTRATDPLWNDYYWHGHLVRLWAFLAERYRDRGDVIVGYDLFNEPFLPGDIAKTTSEPGPGNWNELLVRLVAAVRHYDARMPLVIESAGGFDDNGFYVNRLEGLRYLQLPDDPRLVISPHAYAPGRFTHQGVIGFPTGQRYPGDVDGEHWDRARLERTLQPVEEIAARTGLPVYIGEFSATLQGGVDADRYVADLVNLFNARGWSWSYHSWRDAPSWDAELAAFPGERVRRADTPRMIALRDGIALRPAEIADRAPVSAAPAAPAPDARSRPVPARPAAPPAGIAPAPLALPPPDTGAGAD